MSQWRGTPSRDLSPSGLLRDVVPGRSLVLDPTPEVFRSVNTENSDEQRL